MLRNLASLLVLSFIREAHSTVTFRIPKADRRPTNSRVVYNGGMQFTYPKGVKLDDAWAIKFPSGEKMSTFPDGVRVLDFPDGKVSHYLPDGRMVDTLPTGESTYTLPSGEYWHGRQVSPFAEQAFKSWQPVPNMAPLSLVQEATRSSFSGMSLTAAALCGFVVGSGVVFVVHRLRSSTFGWGEEPLLLV